MDAISIKKLHGSQSPELIPYSVEQDPQFMGSLKPKGLWYSVGMEWEEWCASEMPGWCHPFQFELELEMRDILQLTNPNAIWAFHEQYQQKLFAHDKTYAGFGTNINWGEVAQHYKGIEISPYARDLRLDLLWYYGWDVASGCIWDTTVIKTVNLMTIEI